MKHAEMRILLRDAFARVFGRDATTPELQCLQAVAALESNYGAGWKPPGNGSFNFGAIQCGASWSGPSFQYTDTRPNSDGTSTPYVTKFRKYATPIDGAIDLVKVVYLNLSRDKTVLPAASRGDTLGFSKAMRDSGYYEGMGATIEQRVANHHKAVVRSIRDQAKALNEDLPRDVLPVPEIPPTLRVGSSGPDVAKLQEALNLHRTAPRLIVDGNFGERTRVTLKVFQQSRKLVADGVAGPATWLQLLREPA